MNARTRKRRTCARVLHRARLWAALRAEMQIEDWPEEWDDDECPHCRGDGRDPYTDYLMPCPYCGGDE